HSTTRNSSHGTATRSRMPTSWRRCRARNFSWLSGASMAFTRLTIRLRLCSGLYRPPLHGEWGAHPAHRTKSSWRRQVTTIRLNGAWLGRVAQGLLGPTCTVAVELATEDPWRDREGRDLWGQCS